MTPPTPNGLPGWPKADDYRADDSQYAEVALQLDYERARADAAMVRLRVAIAALSEYRFTDNEQGERKAAEALTHIGTLPPTLPATAGDV